MVWARVDAREEDVKMVKARARTVVVADESGVMPQAKFWNQRQSVIS